MILTASSAPRELIMEKNTEKQKRLPAYNAENP